MQRYICVLALLCLWATGTSQPPATLLKINDPVPDIYFNQVLNSSPPKTNLYSFRKKLVLINFFATTCGVCIHEMPVLDSLQELYRNDLSVIAISASGMDSPERVDNMLRRIKVNSRRAIVLPIILGDSVINKLLPHPFIPYFAWLDENFKLVAVTDKDEVTESHIRAFINGEKLKFTVTAPVKVFDQAAPLFGNGTPPLSGSWLGGYIPGAPTGTFFTKDSTGKVTRLLLTNQPVLALLQRAYHYFKYPARIQWPEGEEALLNSRLQSKQWLVQNSFSYELITPPISMDSVESLLRQDIQRFLHYSAALKKIPTRCYVLTVDSSITQKYASAGGKAINKLFNETNRYLQNEPVSSVADALNLALPLPVLDESGYRTKIDIRLPDIDIRDIPLLRQQLALSGIQLTETSRDLDHFFIYHLPN